MTNSDDIQEMSNLFYDERNMNFNRSLLQYLLDTIV